jgi:hypothetical protein
MRWHKMGLVFGPDGRHDWMVSHAANPVAEHLHDDVFRIYFGCRDAKNRSHIGSADVELGASARLVAVADEPVLSPGPLGTFDDSGTSMGCLVPDGPRTWLFYLGWNLGVTVPWRNSIGLAVRDGLGQPFVKRSLAPLLDRCDADPYTLSYPCVLRDGPRWRMWYGSNLSWGATETDMNHVIKYAESDDGLSWRRDGTVALGLCSPEEFAVCRPWVIQDGAVYRMWYCHRGCSYRLGYAESQDGLRWHRRSEVIGIDVSPDGWDAEMIAYPSVGVHRGRSYLFYNGNRYGRAGFGVAVRDEG